MLEGKRAFSGNIESLDRPITGTVRKQRPAIVLLGLAILSTSLAYGAEGEDVAVDSTGKEGWDAVAAVPIGDADLESDAQVRYGSTKNRAVEEVIVTAQKRGENVQDVPIAIQAFSGEALAARGIVKMDQIAQSVPSLQFTGALGFQMIYIRGIGTDNFVPSVDPSIAAYVDGIYMPQGQSTAQYLGNVERVEVLKGPQGTLFGRNATGGAISIITKEPEKDWSLTTSGGLGNFAKEEAKASLSGPLTDELSFTLSGAYLNQDSYWSDLYYPVQDTGMKAINLKVLVEPIDDVAIVITGMHSEQQGADGLMNKNVSPSPLGRALGIQPQSYNFRSENDYYSNSFTTNDTVYGHVSWSLPWLDVKLLSSRQELTIENSLDFDASRLPLVNFDATNEIVRVTTGELQFVSNDQSWLSDRLKWVAGLYYFKGLMGLNPAHVRVAAQGLSSISNIVEDITGLQAPDGLQDLVGLLPVGNTPFTDEGLAVSIEGLIGTKSYSAYTQATLSATDWLDITLGGRFQSEKRYTVETTTGILNPVSYDIGADEDIIRLLKFPLQSEDEANFSPKAVLSAKPSDDSMIYLSYGVGYKSGSYNIVNIYNAPIYLPPEKVTTYELGAKLDLFSGALRLNGAIFNNDIHNMQTGFVSLLAGGTVKFQTARGARTRGVEFDASWLPFTDWNPGLAVTANAAFVDATFTDFQDASGFNSTTGVYQATIDVTGNHIVRAPRTSGGIGVVQSFDTESGSLEIAVDDYYNSGFYWDTTNDYEQPAYSVLNGHVSYLHVPWNLRVTLSGKNLLDKRYSSSDYRTDFGTLTTLAPPREVSLVIDWRFAR